MKNFLLGLNNDGYINLLNVDGAVDNSGAELVVDFNDRKSRVLSFQNLFIDIDQEYGLVIDKNDVLFANGDIKSLKDIVKNVKKPDFHQDAQVGDFVRLSLFINDDAMITCQYAKNKSSILGNIGIVKAISHEDYTISIDGNTIKLPSVCVRKINDKIMCDEITNMYAYAAKKGHKVKTNTIFNYPSISKDGKFVEYISKDRISRFDGDFWNEELRAKFAAKKKIRGALGAMFDVSSNVIDEMMILFTESDVEVEILEGYDVYKAFDSEENDMDGSIGNSCMINKCTSYFEIYRENAKVAVIRNDDGLIVVRAMLWEIISMDDGSRRIFLDRIYSSNTSLEPIIRAWAVKNKYLSLETQTYGEQTAIDYNGNDVDLTEYYVQLKSYTYEEYPYIDTFCFVGGDRLYCRGGVKSAHTTGGYLSELDD